MGFGAVGFVLGCLVPNLVVIRAGGIGDEFESPAEDMVRMWALDGWFAGGPVVYYL